MGKVLAERLAQELNLPIEWVNIELHPETPTEGKSIRKLFPAKMVKEMFTNLNEMGENYNLKFVPQDIISNSRSSILLGEYIHLNYPKQEAAYHESVFKAYFTEGKDIGKLEILAEILREIGIDPKKLPSILEDRVSQARMLENAEKAKKQHVTATPTFFIGNERIVGAQPYPRLLRAARRALGLEEVTKGDLPIL